MKTRRLLATAALILTMGCGLTAAYADGSTVNIEQYGIDNSVGGGQHGHRNRLTVYQNGRGNVTISTEDGAYNQTVVGQSGRNNSADTYQHGRRNIVGVAQFGSGHTVVTTQDGSGNAVGVIQAGHNNHATTTQVGRGNVSVIVQD